MSLSLEDIPEGQVASYFKHGPPPMGEKEKTSVASLNHYMEASNGTIDSEALKRAGLVWQYLPIRTFGNSLLSTEAAAARGERPSKSYVADTQATANWMGITKKSRAVLAELVRSRIQKQKVHNLFSQDGEMAQILEGLVGGTAPSELATSSQATETVRSAAASAGGETEG